MPNSLFDDSEFAFESAAVLAKHGIKSYVFESLRPTPELSFAVRHLGTFAGIMITASHNPAPFNGYKVYGEDGGQMPPADADALTDYIRAIDNPFTVKLADLEDSKASGLIEVIGESQDYPITPKEHGTDFLMDNRHLWLRSRKQVAVMQIRNAIIYATYEFFDKNGFMKFDSPILSGNAAEDSTELFETDYFGTPAYLSQSGQLYLEAGAMALGRVFDFGPVFRAEKSKTRRHLTEFWMMDAEYSYLTHDESLDLQEAYVKALLQGVLDRAPQALETLERDTDLLKRYIAEPFKRVSYDEAIDLLQAHENDEDADYEHLEHGDDFGSPHETWISNHFGVPTFVMNYPAAIKAFYMKPVPGNPERVLCADLLAPEGYGEIIGGSMREEDYDALVAKMNDLGMDTTEYEFYLDLRKYGTVPHGGFGIGIERMVTFVAGTKHIREAIPFPRMLHRIKP